jgi:hypothetical protein
LQTALAALVRKELVARGSEGAHPPEIPVASGGTSVTTGSPAEPAAPMWMWASVAGRVMFVAVRTKQTFPWPGFIRIVAVPLPSESPGPGISAAPVRAADSGRPPGRVGESA